MNGRQRELLWMLGVSSPTPLSGDAIAHDWNNGSFAGTLDETAADLEGAGLLVRTAQGWALTERGLAAYQASMEGE